MMNDKLTNTHWKASGRLLSLALSMLLLTGLAQTASADALTDEAITLWEFDVDACTDLNGPPFTNWESSCNVEAGVDITTLAAAPPTAENSTGLAGTDTGWNWSEGQAELEMMADLDGASRTLLIRYMSLNWDNGAGHDAPHNTWTISDGSCGFGSQVTMGIFLTTDGIPEFQITGAGDVQDRVSLGIALDTTAWYDMVGVFDSDAGTLTMSVWSPTTGELIGEVVQDTEVTTLEQLGSGEFSMWVTPCNDTAHATDGENFVEKAAMWDRALTADEVAALSGGSLALKVTHSDGSTQVEEEGETTDSFMIELNGQPTADVTVVVNPPTDDVSLNAEAVNDPITLTFTTGNWNVPQAVMVKANDDAEGEGPETIKLAATASSYDEDFNSSTSVSVSVVDNDFAGVAINKAAVGVEEGGADDTYTVTLTFAPTDTVVITAIDTSEPNQVTLNGVDAPLQLTFTTANWSTSQTVTVGAIDDGDAEGNPHAATLSHASFSAGDADYNTLDDVFGIDGVDVTIDENDCDTGGAAGTQTFGPADINMDCVTDLLDVMELAAQYTGCSISLCD